MTRPARRYRPESSRTACSRNIISTFIFLLNGCVEAPRDSGAEGDDSVLDLRMDFPLPENGVQFVVPDLEIGPYEEKMFCFYDAYEGPVAGVVGMLPMFSKAYGHHLFLKDVNEQDENPTGTLIDCTEGETEGMQESVFIQSVQNDYPQGDGDWLSIIPGFAFRLEENQELKVDVHFINPTDQTLLVNAAINLELVPEEEVNSWIGGFDLNLVSFDIPPAQETHISFDCALPTGSAVLSIGGHMHENGLAYRVEHVRGDTVLRTVLDLQEWKETFRYSPPMEMFWPWEVMMEEGDVLRTTCSWLNLGESTLSFPDEMCTTFGVATGLRSGLLCEDGVITDDGQ